MTKSINLVAFQQLFQGREDYFSQQFRERYLPIPRPLNTTDLLNHLSGDDTYGIYVLTKNSNCHFICFDLDIAKSELAEVNFFSRKEKFDFLSPKLFNLLEILKGYAGISEEAILLEDTGGRGYHIWFFFQDPIPGVTAVAFGKSIKNRLDFDIEVFPKQGRLTKKREFGNLIKLPLGIHRKYNIRSVFFQISPEGTPVYFETMPENLKLLEKVVPVIEIKTEIIDTSFQRSISSQEYPFSREYVETSRFLFKGPPDSLISTCSAINQLAAKAENGVRFSRSESFHYANIMLSIPGGENEIHRVMNLSYKEEYDFDRTNKEINDIRLLHPTRCPTLIDQGICPGYCKPNVKRQNENPLLPGTTPCSVWLVPEKSIKITPPEDIHDAICDKANIEVAFYKLKQYYEQDVTIFFDEFDFDFFEKRLDEISTVLSEAFSQNTDPPDIKYLNFEIPKKIDPELNIQYRKMAYSSVFDQVPIQAVFNILGPNIDFVFHEGSYGYRWNKDPEFSLRIFDDWYPAYSRFRNDVLASLQENPSGYHICCDIKGYYDNVDHEILIQQLSNIIKNQRYLEYIKKIVCSYEFQPNSKKGIPQGPPYSRLLANLYLSDLDTKISNVSSGYFRYVDDFVIVFKSYDDAKEGLQQISEQLHSLKLKLSVDKEKQPTIVENTDFERVVKTLDKIHYGILENARQITHLDEQAVSEFYNAIQRNSIPSENLDQRLIEINQSLPSLLYSVTQEELFPHSLKDQLLEISKYLLSKKWFFPRRLRKVFERLFDLQPNKIEFVDWFREMPSAYKCYFLLVVFNKWKKDPKCREILLAILDEGLQDQDDFVHGLAISISMHEEFLTETRYTLENITQSIEHSTTNYPLISLLEFISFLDLPSSAKEIVKRRVNASYNFQICFLLLFNLNKHPSIMTDELFIKGLINHYPPFLYPAAASVLGVLTTNSILFDQILKLFLDFPQFKVLAIELIRNVISRRILLSSLSGIENIRLMFDNISDTEIKSLVQSLINKKSKFLTDEIHRTHSLVFNKNLCLYYIPLDSEKSLGNIEIIPLEVLNNHFPSDLGAIKIGLEELSHSEILPDLYFEYISADKEVRLKYKIDPGFQPLTDFSFSIQDQEDLLLIIEIALDIYQKAVFFRGQLGTNPFISPENLFLNKSKKSIRFRTIGLSLQSPLFISGQAIIDEERSIPLMTAHLLRELLFDSEKDFEEFSKSQYLNPLEAFIVQFIQNMRSTEPDFRYSVFRFRYLVDNILNLKNNPTTDTTIFYLRENLRGALFRNNKDSISWYGMSAALVEHLRFIRHSCNEKDFGSVLIRDKIFLSKPWRYKPHEYSREILNLLYNKEVIKNGVWENYFYGDLLEYQLILSVLFIELVTLARSSFATQKFCEQTKLSPTNDNFIRILIGDYQIDLRQVEFNEITSYDFDALERGAGNLSLKQIGILALTSCEISTGEGEIRIHQPKGMSKTEFNDLAHTITERISRIESDLKESVEKLNFSLRHNEDPHLQINNSEIHDELIVILRDFWRYRKSMKFHRTIGFISSDNFPPHVKCIPRVGRVKLAKKHTLPEGKLTEVFPYKLHRYKASWDHHRGIILNVVIPSISALKLLEDIKGNKIFKRFIHFYSGYKVIFIDLVLFLVLIIMNTFIKFVELDTSENVYKAIFSSILSISNKAAWIMVAKLFLDLAINIPHIKRIYDHILSTRRFN